MEADEADDLDVISIDDLEIISIKCTKAQKRLIVEARNNAATVVKRKQSVGSFMLKTVIGVIKGKPPRRSRYFPDALPAKVDNIEVGDCIGDEVQRLTKAGESHVRDEKPAPRPPKRVPRW